MRQACRFVFLLLACFLLSTVDGQAQAADSLFHEPYQLSANGRGELRLDIKNTNFFHDNEYQGHLSDGYTLPGFRIRPTLSYQPLSNVKLEVGAYLLHYWGTDRYPNVSYSGLPTWLGDDAQTGFHAMPFVRAQATLSPGLHVVIGSLYSGSNHRLTEPLYNPEMSISGDPENGVQVIYDGQRVWADAWCDWQSFIFDHDYHQESFIFGLSSRVFANSATSPRHFYFPIQVVVHHHGGETDTENNDRVIRTWTNVAAGVGFDLHTGDGLLKKVNVEAVGVYYNQQAGSTFPYDNGSGVYVKATAQVGRLNVAAGYYWCHHFITLLGNPHFGTISISDEDYLIRRSTLLRLHADYCHRLGRDISIGFQGDMFTLLPTDAYSSSKGWHRQDATVSVSFGVYLRINASFLLKRFK